MEILLPLAGLLVVLTGVALVYLKIASKPKPVVDPITEMYHWKRQRRKVERAEWELQFAQLEHPELPDQFDVTLGVIWEWDDPPADSTSPGP